MHYYRYERCSDLRVWAAGSTLASWKRVPRHLPGDDSARPMWLAIRQALLDGEVLVQTWNVPADTPFGIRLTIHAPAGGPRSAVAASEPMIDGALSALQAGAPYGDAPIAAASLAKKVGLDVGRVEALIRERVAVFAGSPFLVSSGRVQLSPCDHLCVAGEVRVVADPTLRTVETSGEVYLVEPKAPAPEKRAGEDLLGFLDSHLANDIELAEVANEWTESLPPSHAVDGPDVIRTSRSDGSYVEAYAVPGPEIGHLLQEFDTARLLSEAAAKKTIIELHSETAEGTCASCCSVGVDGERCPVQFPCHTLLALTLPYARVRDIETMRQIYLW